MSLLIVALIGVSLNLYLAHRNPSADPPWLLSWGAGGQSINYPTGKFIEGINVEYGEPENWVEWDFWYRRELIALWKWDSTSSELKYMYIQLEFGYPLPTRTTASMSFYNGDVVSGPWPNDRSYYHPLGLILNPIIYALPIWLLVIGIRWVFITRRSRKRERLGLCVGCAYELGELSVCPECGRTIA